MTPMMVLLRSKRRKRAAAVQKLQHLLPAVFLLGAGGSALASGHAAGVELAIAVLLAMAFLHGRLMGFAQRRRALRVSDEGLSFGGRPFRRGLRAPWTSIRSIDVSDRFASIALKNGRTKRIDLGDLENDGPVRAALRAAQGRLAEMTLT